MWWNLPMTHTYPAISTFHLQIYSFFKIYGILVFMDSTCRGVWCIYLIITGNKILVLIQWLIQLYSFCYGIDCTFVSVLIIIKIFGNICVTWFWGFILWFILYVDLVLIINFTQEIQLPNVHQYHYHGPSKMKTWYSSYRQQNKRKDGIWVYH